MSSVLSAKLLVYPDDCDSFGHVNQASFLKLFEQARWKAIAEGPGVDVFARTDAWPAVRKTTIEYRASAFPGDVIKFDMSLTDVGRTSFSMHQTARRESDDTLLAEADFIFVCVRRDGTPTPVPDEVTGFLGVRTPMRPSGIQQLSVRGVVTGLDVQGDGDAVLFVHGFPLDRSMWHEMASTLTGYQRIIPDLRGMGASEAPEAEYSMGEYAEDLADLLDLLHVESAVLCGLSMGGYVAFEFLRRYPMRVRGLMLLNTRAASDSKDAKRSRDEMIASVRKDGAVVLADSMLPRLLARSSLDSMPHVVERIRNTIGAHSSSGIIGALQAMKSRNDSTDLLAGIEVPTLVVAGKEDQLISLDESQKLAAAIPNAQFTAIADAGHLTPMEQPVATGRVVREFLESHL